MVGVFENHVMNSPELGRRIEIPFHQNDCAFLVIGKTEVGPYRLIGIADSLMGVADLMQFGMRPQDFAKLVEDE